MKVRYYSHSAKKLLFIDMEIGYRVFITYKRRSYGTFGEYATLERTTKQHLVFVTDTGSVVKTKISSLNVVAGLAGEKGVQVFPEFENLGKVTISKVEWYNSEKGKYVCK